MGAHSACPVPCVRVAAFLAAVAWMAGCATRMCRPWQAGRALTLLPGACAALQRMDNMYHRWAPEMETRALKLQHWRKSSQWAALRRDHARIIADDTEVAEVGFALQT